MTDFIILTLIIALAWVNHRRAIWKLRARQKERELAEKERELKAACEALEARMWKVLGWVRETPDEDWPEEI